MESALTKFNQYYQAEYRSLMLKKLGFEELQLPEANELLNLTIQFLQDSQVGYHQFFYEMAVNFANTWRDDPEMVMKGSDLISTSGELKIFENWCVLYHKILNYLDSEYMDVIAQTLAKNNPQTALLRPLIESVWEPIAQEDNWQPFDDLVKKITSHS